MNNITKIFFSLCLVISFMAKPDTIETPLDHPMIGLLDGMPGAIDGQTIANIVGIIRKIRKLQFGDKYHPEDTEGKYLFEGKMSNLSELMEAESKSSTAQQTEELRIALHDAKSDFIRIAMPFLAQARGVKRPVTILIEYWATKNNRPDSLLLNWADAKSDREDLMFDKDIQSLSKLHQLCTDLAGFLQDFITSCPIAFAEFKELIKKVQKQ